MIRDLRRRRVAPAVAETAVAKAYEGVDETTAVLPHGWRDRLILVSNENTHFIKGWCLEVHDLAISKYVAGREKDIDFCRALARHGLTLGAAESCTGGMLGSRITNVAGSSAVFRGGIISYHNDAKERLLHVSPAVLEQWGAVSAPTAEAMADGARRALSTDLGISITGVGPIRPKTSRPTCPGAVLVTKPVIAP